MRHADRFNNYREITAKRATPATESACGHAIARGDRIGWNRGLRRVRCRDCWTAWVNENQEAQMIEDGLTPSPW